jgi:hypothetical protein
MDTARAPSWIAQAERAIREMPDVDSAKIVSSGDEILEVHVVARTDRHAKHVARDVGTVLTAQFGRTIDHRVVSVVNFGRRTEAEALDNGPNGDEPDEEDRLSAAESEVEEPSPAAPVDRIRFGSVNVFVSGRRAQAQVELRWKGVPRMGSASGWSTRDGALKLVAQATLATVQEFLDDRVALGLDAVDVVRVGAREVAVVGLELLSHRTQKSLVGCCTIEADAQQAVVLATLSALNRIVGGLPTKEPTEYVLRPTSA